MIDHLLVVNPTKRFTADDILAHPWCHAQDLASNELPLFNKEMRQYNARRRLRGSIKAVKAACALGRGMQQRRSISMDTEAKFGEAKIE